MEADEKGTIAASSMVENTCLTWNLGIPCEGPDIDGVSDEILPPVCQPCGNPVIRAPTQ